MEPRNGADRYSRPARRSPLRRWFCHAALARVRAHRQASRAEAARIVGQRRRGALSISFSSKLDRGELPGSQYTPGAAVSVRRRRHPRRTRSGTDSYRRPTAWFILSTFAPLLRCAFALSLAPFFPNISFTGTRSHE